MRKTSDSGGSFTILNWIGSTHEVLNLVHLNAKRNNLWKRFRDSLKVLNVLNLYLHGTEQPPMYLCRPHSGLTVMKLSSAVLNIFHSILMIGLLLKFRIG